VIRIAITQAAFDAIAKTLPFGSVAFEGQPNETSERIIFLDDRMTDRLGAMREPGEDYSAAIIRLAASERGRRNDP
jgi:hypothetical protein